MDNESCKQAFLIVTNSLDKSTISQYYKIKEATIKLGDVFILFHTDLPIPEKFNHLNIYAFSNEILRSGNYMPISETLIPGSNHFPILGFFSKNPNYFYYWSIENDVVFHGCWNSFFNDIGQLKSDFITSHIRKYAKQPYWFWWETLFDPHNDVKEDDLYRSFNPIYRISPKALKYVDERLRQGFMGHHEVAFPSLLIKAGFKLADFGCKDNEVTQTLSFCTLHTMRWKPVFLVLVGKRKNLLYHPVKPKISVKQLLVFLKRNILNETKYLTS